MKVRIRIITGMNELMTTKVSLQNHFGVFQNLEYLFSQRLYMYRYIVGPMAKQVSLSNEVVKELNLLRGEESYSQIIKILLSSQPKTDSARIYEAFEPFMEAICKIIDKDMQQPIEILRVICVNLASKKYKHKEEINKLVDILGEYLEGSK